MVKWVIGNRKIAIESNPILFQTEPWDHSDVFYAVRTWLNQHDWDTSVYNDNTVGGAKRRKELYDMIKPTCENHYHVKRHQIGIYPEDRAVMAYGGITYSVGFENLARLMYKGTDVTCVEKQGTVLKMVPFTKDNGVAFIQSQGFVSEYGVALARIAHGDSVTINNYLNTNRAYPIAPGNLGNLTDCDSSGIVIGMKIRGATRLGIDLNTIAEINQINVGKENELGIKLPIKLKDVEESNSPNTHWQGLVGIIKGKGDLYESLSLHDKIFYRNYLLARPRILGGDIRFIDYLKDHRIELNTVLAIVKPQAFYNWLKWKLLETWPSRNYQRGGLLLIDDIRTPTMKKFTNYYDKYNNAIAENQLTAERNEMWNVKGMYDDIDEFADNTKIVNKAIMGDIMNDIVLQDERVKKIDLVLEKIMKNGKGGKKLESKSESDADNAKDDYDNGYDGNEWDD